jgi:hypothetical protein
MLEKRVGCQKSPGETLVGEYYINISDIASLFTISHITTLAKDVVSIKFYEKLQDLSLFLIFAMLSCPFQYARYCTFQGLYNVLC